MDDVAEIQRRADEAAAKWEARGTTAGDSTEQDYIDQGVLPVAPVDATPVVTAPVTPVTTTVTVQNPYFDPNADDTGDVTDQAVTIEVPATTVTMPVTWDQGSGGHR